MRATDALLAVPGLLLSLALVTALGTGRGALAVAVGVPAIGPFARVTRAATLRVRGTGHVEAAVACGAAGWWVVGRHVLPHARHPVLALASMEFGFAVLSVSGLSLLGYGTDPPTPEWGLLVADGRDHLATSWWLSVLPGPAIATTVLALHHIARFLDRHGHKGPKWLRAIEYMTQDRRGFWERGYHNVADPWTGQRHSYQEDDGS